MKLLYGRADCLRGSVVIYAINLSKGKKNLDIPAIFATTSPSEVEIYDLSTAYDAEKAWKAAQEMDRDKSELDYFIANCVGLRDRLDIPLNLGDIVDAGSAKTRKVAKTLINQTLDRYMRIYSLQLTQRMALI